MNFVPKNASGSSHPPRPSSTILTTRSHMPSQRSSTSCSERKLLVVLSTCDSIRKKPTISSSSAESAVSENGVRDAVWESRRNACAW